MSDSVLNLADLLEGIKELGGHVKIAFSGNECKAEIHLPGATLSYSVSGETEHEALLEFVKKFTPTYQLFAEQHANSLNQQMEEALGRFIFQNVPAPAGSDLGGSGEEESRTGAQQ